MMPNSRVLFAVVAASVCWGAQVSFAQQLPTTPLRFHEDFEKQDPSSFFWANSEYKVNFKGLTSEEAHAGKKSLKIDITLGSTGAYWFIPVQVPAEGKLAFHGRLMLGPESTGKARADIEAYVQTVPPNTGPVFGFGVEKVHRGGKAWTLVKGDIHPQAERSAQNSVNRAIWSTTRENIGIYLEGMVVRLFGEKGDRVVLYMDDFIVEGDVPDAAEYARVVDRRWEPVRKRVEEKLDEWARALAEIGDALNKVTPAAADRAGFETVSSNLAAARKTLAAVQTQGYIRKDDHGPMEDTIATLRFAARNLTADRNGLLEGPGGRTRCYVVKPTSSTMILPDTEPVPGELSTALTVTAARGEYEPVSFVLRPESDLADLRLKATALTHQNTGATIPVGAVDIKSVKCWYQAEGAWVNKKRTGPGRVLIPELLLNDDGLVKVDTTEKRNYLKLRFAEGLRYIGVEDIGREGEDVHPAGNKVAWPIAKLPIRDADTLQPLAITAGANKQFWVTIHVPADVPAGVYDGRIELHTADGTLGALTLSLTVLPFDLRAPGTFYDPAEPFVVNAYYNGRLTRRPEHRAVICSDLKSEGQLRQDLVNFYAHGILPTVNQMPDDTELLSRYLEIFNEAGFAGKPVYFTSDDAGFSTGSPTGAAGLAALSEKVKKVMAVARQHGVPEVYVYGLDEATDERQKAQRAAWQVVHEAGAKVWVAASAGTFEAMGDLLDVCNLGGGRSGPDPAEPAKWHAVGHKIWNYGNPQGGVEDPELYRRNYGLLLWRVNYDGGGPWAWQSSAAGGMWNDFNDERRAVAVTYPAAERPIDTIAWEGFREAVDDVRYGTTLKLAIAAAKEADDEGRRKLAADADRFLAEFDVTGDLDAIRRRIIEYILQLRDLEGAG